MKNLFASIVPILAILFIFTSCDNDPNGEIILKKKYVQHIYSIAYTPDNGAVIAGETAADDRGMDWYIVKIDNLGKEKWSHQLSGKNFDTAESVIITGNGDIVAAGATESFDFDGQPKADENDRCQYAMVIRYNANGSVLWKKVVGMAGLTNGAMSIDETKNGDLVMTGFSAAGGAMVVKLDSTGRVIWNINLPENGSGHVGQSIKASVDTRGNEEYVIAETFYSAPNGSGSAVTKIDSLGEVVWKSVFFNSGMHARVEDIALDQDGYMYMVGSRSLNDIPDKTSDAWVVKLDYNGSVIWENTYGGNFLQDAKGVAIASGGGVIFTGKYTNANTFDTKSWAGKIGPNGNMAWSVVFGGSGDNSMWSVDVVQGGGYILGGDTRNDMVNWNDAYIIRMGENGEI